jgi:hypothetical protein
VLGAGLVAGRLRPRWRLPIMLALATAMTAWGGARTVSRVIDRQDCERGAMPPAASCVRVDQASFFEATRYIRERLPEDAVLLTAKPEPLFHYTGRRTLPATLALGRASDSFLPVLMEYGADYVLLGSLSASEVARIPDRLEPMCRDLEVMAEFPPRTYLFRVRAADEPRDEHACQALAAARAANEGRDFWRDP